LNYQTDCLDLTIGIRASSTEPDQERKVRVLEKRGVKREALRVFFLVRPSRKYRGVKREQ
jgi:hypothetical protein